MTSTNVHLRANQTVELVHFGPGYQPAPYAFASVELSQPYGRDPDKGPLSGVSVTLMIGLDSAPVALALADALRAVALRFLPEPDLDPSPDPVVAATGSL